MNFLIVFVAVFAVAYGDANCTSSTKPNLEDDIKAITKLIPVSKIKAIALKYIANDAEVQAVVKYMKGSEFAALVKAVNDEKLVKDLYTFLCSNGVDIYKDVNTVNKLLELPEVQPQGRVLPAARTFRGFLDEVEAELPLGDMKKVFEQKKATSAVFKAFFDKISGSEFRVSTSRATGFIRRQHVPYWRTVRLDESQPKKDRITDKPAETTYKSVANDLELFAIGECAVCPEVHRNHEFILSLLILSFIGICSLFLMRCLVSVYSVARYRHLIKHKLCPVTR